MSKYYIGDLCYVLPRELYEKVICGQLCEDGEWHIIDGVTFAFSNTAYGDGSYRDQNGKSYCVDAGIIGIVKLDGSFVPEDFRDWGHIFEFEEQPVVVMNKGVFQIGNIFIDTRFKDEQPYESGDWQ